MTLQIKDVEIAGVSAIKVRNALRDVTQVNKDYLADRCKLSTRRAQQVIDALVKDGFLCPPHKEKKLAGSYRPPEKPRYRYVDYYKLTNKGEKLALASAVNKMPRAKAEEILAAFLKRVEEVNATEEYLYSVACVVVYGSFARGAEFLSDVDVAFELSRKRPVSKGMDGAD